MANKLNQAFIHLDTEALFKNAYCETNVGGTAWIKYTTPSTNTGTSETPGDSDLVIPYTSLVFIKDTLLFWTHGKVYRGTDANATYSVGSGSKSFVIGSTTYVLKMDGTDKFVISSETPASFTVSAVADTSSSTGGGTYYDGASHAVTATSTPSNAVNVKIASSGTHTGVTITGVLFSTDKTNWGSVTSGTTDSSTGLTKYTVTSGTTGYVAAATLSDTATSGTKTTSTPSTLYVRVMYTLDGSSTECYSGVTTISHSAKSVTVTLKIKVYYRTSDTGDWTLLGDYDTTARSFARLFSSGSVVGFAWPTSIGTNYTVSYGPSTDACTSDETTMFSTVSVSNMNSRAYTGIHRVGDPITNGAAYKAIVS